MQTENALQWGGRFNAPPDARLIAFGSSLDEDLVLAEYDVECSRAHVRALEDGGIVTPGIAAELRRALDLVANEIESGQFAALARESQAEDVHGAIDARVRSHAPDAGEWLHAGRSRNDQVATTLLLYAHARAVRGLKACVELCDLLLQRARIELDAETVVAAVTHWQPAQPMLLAFWLCACAEMAARAAHRFAQAAAAAKQWCPLGSGAVTGSTLPLARASAAAQLGFAAPSRNAMDAIGTRDAALDVLHALTRTLADFARISNDLVIWSTPAFGYVRLGDAASTGSSLMPQKRNPDPFELVRAHAAAANGTYAGALGTLGAIGLSYHRDLQITKALILSGTQTGLPAVEAFCAAFEHVHFNREAMGAKALDGYTIATDLADAMILSGTSPRAAHAAVGKQVAAAERDGTGLANTTALESAAAKRTSGSTNPAEVRANIDALQAELETLK